MSEYLDRVKVIEGFEKCVLEHPTYPVLRLKFFLEKLPEAEDVAPVRHGRWIKEKEHFYLDCGCKEWTNYFCSL